MTRPGLKGMIEVKTLVGDDWVWTAIEGQHIFEFGARQDRCTTSVLKDYVFQGQIKSIVFLLTPLWAKPRCSRHLPTGSAQAWKNAHVGILFVEPWRF